MATKKIKRFESGGVSDKDRGLEASKDDKVGFFERLRMGNIDEEGSEAYNRFGAGRAKADRDAESEAAAMRAVDASRAAPAAPAAPAASAASPAAAENKTQDDSGAFYEAGSGEVNGTKPDMPVNRSRVNVQAGKPSTPAKSPPKQAQTYSRSSGDTGARPKADTSNYSNEGRSREMTTPATPKPSMRRGSVSDIPLDSPRTPVTGEKVDGTELGRNLATTMAALGPVKGAGAVRAGVEFARANRVQDAFNKTATARRTAEMRAKGDATKFSSKPKATQKDSTKKTKKFDDEESNVEFKRGGMVSSASKRADGIATKGKTRCKMR